MIKKVSMHELDALMSMIKDVVAGMLAAGLEQWSDEYPTRSIFENDIKEEHLYGYYDNGELCGVICLDHHEPEEYLPLAWTPCDSFYVMHRMAVSPKHRGKGIGASLMSFALTLAKKEGIEYLRTDTYSQNKKLLSMFDALGYEKVSDMAYHGKKEPFFCYERKV